jgi:DNA-binding IclR family transcriptional regulator
VAYSHDLGPVSLRFGEGSRDQVEAVRVASNALPQIAEQVGQHTIGLAVWGNHGPTAVRWEPSKQPVSDQLLVGLVMSITHLRRERRLLRSCRRRRLERSSTKT